MQKEGKTVDKIINKASLFYGVIVTALTAVLGDYWFLFVGFLVSNVIDYVTGIAKSKYYGMENSSKGAKGIVKKTGYWIVIAISFFISFAFVEMGQIIEVNLDFVLLFGWFTLATYIINEIRSIFENLIEMGVNIPKWLVKGLEAAAETVENKMDKGDK